MHNADNSGTAGSTRRTVGLSGFIVLQTFNSQVKNLFYSLLQTALELEKMYSHRAEIEWGIKGDIIYIFQVRPY